MDAAALFTTFASIAVAQVLGWAIPGPNHLSIVSATVSGGRGAGLAAAFGIAAGALTWALLAVSGIAVLFELFPSIFVTVRLVGAGYLIYLGVRALRSLRSGGMLSMTNVTKTKAQPRPFLTSYLVMMTNPKAVLFFGSILTAFIPPEGSLLLMILIVAQIAILGTALNVCAALFFSTPAVLAGFEKAGPTITVAFGLLFCGLGVWVGYETIHDLLRAAGT